MLDAKDWQWIAVVVIAALVIVSAGCAVVGYVIHRDARRGTDNFINRRRERNGGRMIAIGSMSALGFAFGLIVVLLLALQPR